MLVVIVLIFFAAAICGLVAHQHSEGLVVQISIVHRRLLSTYLTATRILLGFCAGRLLTIVQFWIQVVLTLVIATG